MVAAEANDKVDNGSTRARIKAVARELFIRHGVHKVTYGHIAERVGTTRANLHYHFGNKNALVAEVFQETYAEVEKIYSEIWLKPGITLDRRIELTLEDARRRFNEFNDSPNGRIPWSLSARTQFENIPLPDEIRRGIARMSRQFEEYVEHAVRLAIGSGELRPDTPTRTIVLLVAPLWYFGSAITQHGGFEKLEAHYNAVRQVIRDAYGT
jgi:Transcriptional regulator